MVTWGKCSKIREMYIIVIKEEGLQKNFANLKEVCQSIHDFAVQQSQAVKALRLIKHYIHYIEVKH